MSPAQPGLPDCLHRINHWLLGQGNFWRCHDTYKTPFYVQRWEEELIYWRENQSCNCNLKNLLLQMIPVKLMLKRLLKRMPVLCKFHYKRRPRAGFCSICVSYSHLVSPFSPFQGSIEAEENSPSGSTPASPQTKTASEGELSTTAAELLQDYMTTVGCFNSLICLTHFLVGALGAHTISFFSWGPSCHLRRFSSLPRCSMSTATALPSMSSALTCDSCTGTAGSFSYSVGTPKSDQLWLKNKAQ